MKFAQGIAEDGIRHVFEYLNGKHFLIEGYSDINDIIREGFENIKKTEYKAKIKFLPSVSPEKIFLPAVNFKSHSMESDTKHPVKPYFFTKFRNALTSTESQILKPRGIEKLDYEGEIGIIIGKRGKYIQKSEAMNYV
ncbi:MAG: fumarylacetoacetate hydrolase family protein, partial [Thermoplasmata archaeon]